MTEDLVCGKPLNEKQAISTSTHKIENYYFCSLVCKEKFDRNPKEYTEKKKQPKGH
jgi:YHS domain-containing protein